MAQTEVRFGYFDVINGPVTRIFTTAVILFFGLMVLGLGDNVYKIIGPGNPAIEPDHSIFSMIAGTALLLFGCAGIFWSWRLLTKPSEIILSMESVSAPSQGVFGHVVEIFFTEITYLQKLSIDGKWEFKIASRDKHIRVAKGSFKVVEEFEKFVKIIQKHAPNCKMEIEERIEPPCAGGGAP